METLLTLVIWGALTYWCYRIAEKNGRDKGWSIVWGLLGGIFAVIIYAILGPTPEQKIINAERLLKKQN